MTRAVLTAARIGVFLALQPQDPRNRTSQNNQRRVSAMIRTALGSGAASRASLTAVVFLVLALAVAHPAGARITKVVINKDLSSSPTFGGFSWPGVGQYEKIVGSASGELDPKDRRNAVIVDIELAPKNKRGNVEYSFDFYILKPVDLDRGNRRVMYEPPNRGRKTWQSLGRVVSGGNDPGSITDPKELANAFLMPRGFTMVWSGWDASAGTSNANFNMTIALPIATKNGAVITGPAYEYIVSGAAVTKFPLSYAAADVAQAARLTHRVHLNDLPVDVPRASKGAAGWAYNADGTAISLVDSTGAAAAFVAQDIYEFSYTAKNPTVNGIGFAAVRDFNAWLRYAKKDDAGMANPLAGHVDRIYTEISSQPGRLLNDFRHLGFNEAENGRKVFDGHMQWIAAGDGINLNYRFSQPGRTERNRQDHLYAEGVFPFANVMTFDPILGKADSRYARCERTGTCPFGVEIYSANEYWVKAASLLHTDPTGRRDLHDSRFTRNYLISSHQHGTAPPVKGNCQQLQNPLNSAPIQRALFVALDEWATNHRLPPRSRVPRFHDGTLVPPDQESVGFPHIPGVKYTGLKTTRYLFDYGAGFYSTGIATINPPFFPSHTPSYQDDPRNGPIYPSFVPRTDSDGNDIAGIRLGDVSVPLATYTGWGLRSGPQADDGCESSGQFIPFAKTAADRAPGGANAGDPRPSVAERYGTLDNYTALVVAALRKMVRQRTLLCEDFGSELSRLVSAGAAAGLPGTPLATTPACHEPRGDDEDEDDDD